MIWSVGISGEFDTQLCPIVPTGVVQVIAASREVQIHLAATLYEKLGIR
jgi:hypothetical protein